MIHLNKYIHLTVLSGTIFLTSCTKVEINQPNEKAQAIQFTSTINTRATATAFEINDAIGIYMLNSGSMLSAENVVEKVSNRHYVTYDRNTFNPFREQETIYLPKEDIKVDFICYYPYSEQVNADYTIPVNIIDQSKPAAIDLLYSNNSKEVDHTNPTAQLNFKHKLVRLQFKLIAGKGLTEESLKGASVILKGMSAQATFSLATGILTPKSSEADILALTAENGKSSEALIFPATGKGKQFIFQINKEYFYYNLDDSDSLIEGEQYSYNVTLHHTVDNATGKVENWTEVAWNIEVEP